MLLQDLRYAVRMLRRSPGFAAAAILSMALGIGANTAIFSLIHTLLLRPLPVQAPEELVEPISWLPQSDSPRSERVRVEALHAFPRPRAGVLQPHRRVAGTAAGGRWWRRQSRVSRRSMLVGSFFPTLGLRPALGRLLEPDDDRAEAPGAAVISWAYWQRRFNGDPAVLGQIAAAQRRAGNHRRRRAARVLRLAGGPQPRCLGAVGDGAADAATEPARGRLADGQDHGAAAARGVARAGRGRDAGARPAADRGSRQESRHSGGRSS